jgi:hypothetical protein
MLGAPGQVKQVAGGYIIEKAPDLVRIQKVRTMCDYSAHIQTLAARHSPVHLEPACTQRV